jgi:hypothetical protein
MLKPAALIRCRMLNRHWAKLCIDDSLWLPHVYRLTGAKNKVRGSYYNSYTYFYSATRIYKLEFFCDHRLIIYCGSINEGKRIMFDILKNYHLIVDERLIIPRLNHCGEKTDAFIKECKYRFPNSPSAEYKDIQDEYFKILPDIIDDVETLHDFIFEYRFSDNIRCLITPSYP